MSSPKGTIWDVWPHTGLTGDKVKLLTKVTSRNSSSSLMSEKAEVMLEWKSFHRRQNCSVAILSDMSGLSWEASKQTLSSLSSLFLWSTWFVQFPPKVEVLGTVWKWYHWMLVCLAFNFCYLTSETCNNLIIYWKIKNSCREWFTDFIIYGLFCLL